MRDDHFPRVLLQIDEKHGSGGLKKTIASVIAPRWPSWFGDLVTMKCG